MSRKRLNSGKLICRPLTIGCRPLNSVCFSQVIPHRKDLLNRCNRKQKKMCSISDGRQKMARSVMRNVNLWLRKIHTMSFTSSLRQRRNFYSRPLVKHSCQKPTTVRKNTSKGHVRSQRRNLLIIPANPEKRY